MLATFGKPQVTFDKHQKLTLHKAQRLIPKIAQTGPNSRV
jgi:hypothetical protein